MTHPSFVGRARDLGSLVRSIGADRLVSVIGPGGCGKTRLLVAEAVSGGLVELLGFTELASVRPGASPADAVLAACGIRDEPGTAPADRLRDQLGSGVLVLDNCEQIRADVAGLVVGLLRDCPGVRVLVTSRVTLGVTGETVVQLGGLDPDTDGLELFLDCARRVQPALPDGPDTDATARRICRLADGLPLAIELAASHARALPLARIETRMADRLTFLVTRDPGALPQHRSLLASITWSADLVGTPARRALAALALIEGRFTFDAAQAVTASAEAVETLVDHSLVQFDPRDGRYLLLDAVRDFAVTELAPDTDAFDRLAAWVAEMVAAAGSGLGRADSGALETVVRDDAAVRSALGHAVRTGSDLERAAQTTVDLAFAWFLRGRCAEGREWAGRIGDAVGTPQPALLWAQAFLSTYAGDLEAGFALATEAAAVADGRTRARALILTGMATMFGDPAGAAPVLAEAAALALAAGDDWGHVEALQTLAYARLTCTDLPAALACADAAAPALGRLDHAQLRAWDHAIRADVATALGDLDGACRHGRAAIALATTLGEPVSANGGLLPLLRALGRLGLHDEATAVVAAQRSFLDSHPGLGTSEALLLAEALATPVTDLKAAPRAERAMTALGAAGMATFAAEAAVLLARSRLARHDGDAALLAADDALRWAGSVGNREAARAAELIRCVVDRERGGVPLADAHRVLAEAVRTGLRPLVADALDLVAGLTIDVGRPAVAARLHGVTGRMRSEMGGAVPPSYRVADEAAVAAALDGTVLSAARAEGARLTMERAVAFATRSRGRRERPRSGWESLTPTEHEVIALATRGLSNRAIGAELLSSEGTVRTHLRSVFAKLGVTGRAELAAEAARRGL